jgi:hypothetical protein
MEEQVVSMGSVRECLSGSAWTCGVRADATRILECVRADAVRTLEYVHADPLDPRGRLVVSARTFFYWRTR